LNRGERAAVGALLRSLLPLFCREIVADDGAALHHELDGFEDMHGRSRVTAYGDQIGIVTSL